MKENFKELFKKYAYYIMVFVALVMLTMVITLIGIATTRSNAVVETNANNVVYTMPILNGTVQKDYSNSELQWNKTLGQWETHKAVDFVANTGTKVYAFADGVVSKVYSNSLVGTCVEISHGDELSSVYKFLDSSLEVKEGDSVKSGQVIGKVSSNVGYEGEDNTHLHFEVWKNGSSIDPSSYLDMGNK